jgi:hypothetical protein
MAQSYIGVTSWPIDLKEEQYNMRLAFVWRKQQKCDVTKSVKDRCNDTERQDVLAKPSEKISIALH